MSINVPAALNLHTEDWDLDPRARGAFIEGQPATRNTKSAGNLPITQKATAFINTQASNANGVLKGTFWEFLASGGYDVSQDTVVAVWMMQFNAPNRIQVTDKARNGIVFRVGSGGSSPPSAYKTFQIGGNDTVLGSSQQGPVAIVIDLNALSNEGSFGTFDNTNVQTYGFGTVRFNLSATSTTQYFFCRLHVFETTATGSMPEFTGLGSNWDEMVTAVLGTNYTNKIGNDWVRKSGTTVNVYAPWRIGDGVTATTFNDNGFSINGAPDNDSSDPRFRLTSQALRCYIRLRDNAADVVVLSGTYNYADSNSPDVDFNVNNAAQIILEGSTWIGRGVILLGSSVSGGATYRDCTRVEVNGANIDGSRTINTDVHLNTVTDLTNVFIEGDLRINTGTNATLNFSNVTVTGNVYNDASGNTLTINSSNGSLLPTVESGTGNGQVNIEDPVDYIITGLIAGESEVTIKKGIIRIVNQNPVSSSQYTYNYQKPQNPSTYQLIVVTKGFVTIDEEITLGIVSQIKDLNLEPDPSWVA